MGNTTSNSKIEDLESLTLEATKPLNNADANDCSAGNNSWQTMKVDSSNLPSRLKLPKSKDLKSKEDSPLGQRKRSLQRTQSVPVPSIEDSTSQPKKPKVSVSSRKLSLHLACIDPSHEFAFSNDVTNKEDKEENDETLLNLGEAIRSGNEENVLKIIGANSIRIESLVSKIGLMFETYLRKKDIAKDSENICSDSKKKKLDEMFVSPFQLAILAQQSKVVLVMLEGLLKYTKTPIETFAKLLAMKTEVSFARGSPFSYVFEDMNLDGVNSFHLAARFHAQSLLTIVKFLRNNDILEHVSPLLLVSEPHLGKTPLHMAAKSPSCLSLRVLLSLDYVDVDVRDTGGFTALHMASKEGIDLNCQLLLENGADSNVFADKQGVGLTPLHLAKTQNVVNLLIKHGANPFTRQTGTKKSVMDKLLENHPLCVEEIMNLGIQTNGQELDSTDLQIIFNFESFFYEGLTEELQVELQKKTICSRLDEVDEVAALSKLANSSHKDLLSIPLVEAFLHIKWQLIKDLFYCNVAFYATFMVMLTIMTLLLGNMSQCDNEMNNLESNNDLNCSKYNKVSDKNFWTVLERHIENQENSYQNTLGYLFIVSFIMTILGLVFITIREIVQLITNFKKYFESSESLVEALLIILTTLTIILMFHDKDLAIHTGAWAVFLGWWELSLLIGRFPGIGIYFYMSVEVLKTLFFVFWVYLPVLIAFAIMFHLLLPSMDEFKNAGSSFTVLAMMTGELDYGDRFLYNSEEFGSGSVQVALFLFIMIVNIVISNLLVGLTVSETDKIFNKAGILRLKRTVSQIVAIDLVQGGKTWQKCFRCLETNKKRKLFSYLHSLLTKDVSNVDKTPSAWKICVLPNSRIHEGSKERRVLDIHGSDENSLSLDRQYATYLYNDIEESIREKLKFTLPSWVILHALKLLEKQKTDQNEEIVKEMTNNSTNVEDLFGDQPIINQDLKFNSEATLLQRSVSTQPQLSQISEQEIQTDKDAMMQKLQKKINVLQSNLQELQELINQTIE